MGQALAPERASITDIYRGAGKSLEQSGVRGGARELAEAELSRDRAGKLAGLAPTARMGAAAAMTGIGGTQLQAGQQASGMGVQAKQAGGSLLSSMYGLQNQRAYLDAQNAQQLTQGMGGMLFDALKAGSGKKSSGSSPLASSSAPSMGGFAPYAPTVPMVRP